MNEGKVKRWQLQQRQSLTLDAKIKMTTIRIRDFYKHMNGNVYVAFSGGKDSTVLLHLVRSIYPNVPAVFVDTGLEYPEIKEFVRSVDNVTWLRPEMNFKEVLEKYGYPVVSKKVARFVRDLQNPTKKNEQVRRLRLTGVNQKREYCPTMKCPKKWLGLANAPFKVSEQCCDVFKKQPMKKYMKEAKRNAFIGVMASDSDWREHEYLRHGCNRYDFKEPQSHPLSFWLEKDVWNYLKTFDISYSKIYDMGEQRTGCIFCMFGVHLEKKPNRFQRMAKTHPKLYKYCMEKLGLKEVLDYIGVDWRKVNTIDKWL